MDATSEFQSMRNRSRGLNAAALRWSMTALAAATWFSGMIFGAYIIAFFGGAALRGAQDRWNEALPALHDPGSPMSNLAIGEHLITGGVRLRLGLAADFAGDVQADLGQFAEQRDLPLKQRAGVGFRDGRVGVHVWNKS